MEILTSDESFVEMISKNSPEMKKMIDNIVSQKDSTKESKKGIAEITKEILFSEAVRLDDKEVTFGELMTVQAVANTMKKSDLGFKDLADMQKVIGENVEKDSGVVINLITNGQDLGD